jgi:hypothetical protein
LSDSLLPSLLVLGAHRLGFYVHSQFHNFAGEPERRLVVAVVHASAGKRTNASNGVSVKEPDEMEREDMG